MLYSCVRNKLISKSAFYVSTNGSDAWSGHYATPLADGSDGPFATISHARDMMRADPTIKTTYVRSGTYCQNTALTLDERDNGVTIEAFAGEKVVISGGASASGWLKGSDG